MYRITRSRLKVLLHRELMCRICLDGCLSDFIFRAQASGHSVYLALRKHQTWVSLVRTHRSCIYCTPPEIWTRAFHFASISHPGQSDLLTWVSTYVVLDDNQQCPPVPKGDMAHAPLAPVESLPRSQSFSIGWVHALTSLLYVYSLYVKLAITCSVWNRCFLCLADCS